jgi:hypothetical protein
MQLLADVGRKSMRTTLVLVSLVLLCLSVSLSFAAPDLQVENPTFNVGEIFQGEKVPHTFEFINQGDEVLNIDRVRSSCGCTAVLISEKSIPPGGKGELQANFDSARFRGSISKTIYLYSNDPVRPTMQFHIKGNVLETVAVEPSQVNFGKVEAEKPVTTTVVLRNQGKETLSLGKPHSTAIELVAKMPESAFANGDEVRVELQFTPKPGLARFSGYVLVPVDGVPRNELRIPVYATISQ